MPGCGFEVFIHRTRRFGERLSHTCCLLRSKKSAQSTLQPSLEHQHSISSTPHRSAGCTGSWYTFFDIIGYAAVLSNLGVVVFTTTQSFFGIDTLHERFVAFVIIEV